MLDFRVKDRGEGERARRWEAGAVTLKRKSLAELMVGLERLGGRKCTRH